MAMRLFFAGIVMLSAASAHAEHMHAMDHDMDHAGTRHVFGAAVTMVAASYDQMLYSGNYQGVMPAMHWSRGRFSAAASGAMYRIEENGAEVYGLGDVFVHGQATLVGDHRARAGVLAGISAPVGDEVHGLGMGHAMVMPGVFGAWTIDRVALSATAMYGRALADTGGHDHGMWPIVEPMNMQELMWSAAGDVVIVPKVTGGARLSGGVPIGDGDNRVVGALRVGWETGRFTTAAEVQAGLAGDPFNLRGLVSTALSF
jgi:hypothetical protein